VERSNDGREKVGLSKQFFTIRDIMGKGRKRERLREKKNVDSYGKGKEEWRRRLRRGGRKGIWLAVQSHTTSEKKRK